MKGSPIIATAITIVALLGLYIGMRAILLPEDPQPASTNHHDHSGHDHSGHNHGSHSHGPPSATGHDDSSVETDFEIYFSSTPKSLKITQPSTEKEIFDISEFESPEWFGSGVLSLEGHHIELEIEVTWEKPAAMNMVEVILNPAKHDTRSKTLRNDDNISDIADFSW